MSDCNKHISRWHQILVISSDKKHTHLNIRYFGVLKKKLSCSFFSMFVIFCCVILCGCALFMFV